jgi:hypothetical protein
MIYAVEEASAAANVVLMKCVAELQAFQQKATKLFMGTFIQKGASHFREHIQ